MRVYSLPVESAVYRLQPHGLTLNEKLHPRLGEHETFAGSNHKEKTLVFEIEHDNLKWPKGTEPFKATREGNVSRFSTTAKQRQDFAAAVQETYGRVVNPEKLRPGARYNHVWHAFDAEGKPVLYVDELNQGNQIGLTINQQAAFAELLERKNKKGKGKKN